MPDPWQAERDLSPTDAETLIAMQFPELLPITISLFGEGWDNYVFLVNDQWLFHFPRRAVAADLLEGEIATLRWLAHATSAPPPLMIPYPHFVGEPTESFDWPFVGYSLIQGETWCRADVSIAARQAAAVPLARFLRWLHSQPLTAELCSAAPPDTIGRLDLSRRVPQAEEYLARAEQLSLAPAPDALRVFLGARAPLLRQPKIQALVHGDLYSRHLVVDSKQQLAGVIDWGDVHRGDPASDLAIAYLVLPSDAHDTFRAAYGRVDEETWTLAHFAALRHALITTVYGHDTNDEALVRESRFALQSLAERL